MDPEEIQADLIRQFSERAAKLMPSQEGTLPLASQAALAALVVEATSHPDLFDFSTLLCLPAISWLRKSQYCWHVDALGIFAYGTLKDYTRHKDILPKLNWEQLQKLRDITLLTLVEARQLIPFDDLMMELGIENIEELEGYLLPAAKKLGIGGTLNLTTRFLEVSYAPKIHGVLTCGQSLEVHLQASAVCHFDAQTGILSNGIATQVKVPLSRCGRHYCLKVDFKPRGSEIFIHLIGLTSDGHLAHKSWNGLIYPGMFGVSGRQVFLRPGTAPWRKITDKNSMNDYGSIDDMIKRYAGLKFPHRNKSGQIEQVMYPVYVGDLRSHLQGKKPHISSKIRALDVNFIVFLKCHPSLLTTSARSVVFFHVRKEYKSSNASDKTCFSSAIRSVKLNCRWWRKLGRNWLFQNVFLYASNHGKRYQNNATDCHRCIRDWETHGREHFSDDERRIFTIVVLTYLVEHFFGDFFPEILYNLLCGPPSANMDLKDWLYKLQRLSPNDTPNTVLGHQGI